MIDFDAMEVGQQEKLPHPSMWEGANRREYNQAQECTTRTNKIFVFDIQRNDAGQIVGFTVTRTE